jgi:prefoldin subunit 5
MSYYIVPQLAKSLRSVEKKINELEKTNMEKNEMLLSLLSQLDIITQSSIQKSSEKQEDRINTLEARVKELEDEVKYLKTLPQGLMETLGYKKK